MIVIGNDSHKQTVMGVAASGTGAKLAELEVPARARGYRKLLDWARSLDADRVWAVEDCRHLAESLVRFLLEHGERVVRVPPKMMAGARRGGREYGKSDSIDALAVARAYLKEPDRLVVAQVDDSARAVRLIGDLRDDLVGQRTAHENRLRWLLHELDADFEATLKSRQLGQRNTLDRVTRRLAREPHTALVDVCKRLTRQVRALSREIDELERQLAKAIAERNPTLQAIEGCGVLTAATIVGRLEPIAQLAHDAKTAYLAGVAPLDASSGRQQRHRLNRRGDRKLNSCLHRIAVTQLRVHEPAREYVARRIADGKTKREAIRCLKRYIARRVHHALVTDTKLRSQQGETTMPNRPTQDAAPAAA